jgi:hypothetical protein
VQNLSLRFIPVQEIFYVRQLSENVFNIHNFKSEKAKFYIYHEGVGRINADEVCSFILSYIDNELPKNVKYFHIFSYACPGQKGINPVVRFVLAPIQRGKLETVSYYLPLREGIHTSRLVETSQ